MKTYDLVKQLLTDYPELRDSDKRLQWKVLEYLGYVKPGANNGYITYFDFIEAPSMESIRRSRQKVQENHPELQSSKWIREQRQKIEDQKGTHIFREEIRVQESLI